MAGVPIDLRSIDLPSYVLGTEDDHIVPWRSAFATTSLVSGRSTFVLGASGHIAGIVNPPQAGKRHYATNDRAEDDPEKWLAGARRLPGSWWPHWSTWLAQHGGAWRRAPVAEGSPDHPSLDAAPGRYVVEKVA